MVEHDVKDLARAAAGRLKIEGAEQSMPVLRQIRERFTHEQPLKGIRLGACLHVTTETAVLMLTLKAAGAQLALCASNPLSTQDDTAAALVREYDVPVFAQKGEDHARYYRHIAAVLATRPQLTMDDGADLISQLHGPRKDLAADVIGGTEETTTGVVRLRSMGREGALEAVMDGFPVLPMTAAAAQGDVFVTVTGNTSVMSSDHFGRLKDGAILCNSGHFNVEIDLETLGAMARSRRGVRPFVEEFTLESGRRLYVLGEGRLINLTAAEGHPASVMDMSFANQALAAEYMVKHGRTLARKVYGVPREIDLEIARLKLASMGVEIDQLTAAQRDYLASWTHGT